MAFMVINVDKKETLTPYDYHVIANMENWCHHHGMMVLALHNLLLERWKGDRVYVFRDHMPSHDDGDRTYSNALAYVREVFGTDDVYDYAYEHCRNLKPGEVDSGDHGLRYIYNHALKTFIDLARCPRDGDDIAPLPLLIAVGHVWPFGGSFNFEYDEDMKNVVGSWCDSVQSIEVRKEPLYDVDYEEFRPGFSLCGLGRHVDENASDIPHFTLKSCILEVIEDVLRFLPFSKKKRSGRYDFRSRRRR